MPILPWIEGKNLIVPIVTAIAWATVQYTCWYIFIYVVLGTAVISMNAIENIPGEYVVPVLATIIASAFVLYVVFYLVAFNDKKTELRKKKVEALQEGKAISEMDEERIQSFHFIYKIAMFLGIIVTSAIAFALMATIVPEKLNPESVMDFCVYAGVVTTAVYIIFDTFVGRPIADGTFKNKVLKPIEEGIIAKFRPADDSKDATADFAISEEDKKLIELFREIRKKD